MTPPSTQPGLHLVLPLLGTAADVWTQPAHALDAWDGGGATLATDVRLAVAGGRLIAAFRCAHGSLHADPSLPRDRGVDGLWQRDVVELFVATESEAGGYTEFEASPCGQWLALRFSAPRQRRIGLATPRPEVAVQLGAHEHRVLLSVALAELPFRCARGRLGLFRIHGREPARGYLALTPNGSARPDFHRPASWASFEIA